VGQAQDVQIIQWFSLYKPNHSGARAKNIYVFELEPKLFDARGWKQSLKLEFRLNHQVGGCLAVDLT